MSGKFIVLFAVLAVCTLQMDEVVGLVLKPPTEPDADDIGKVTPTRNLVGSAPEVKHHHHHHHEQGVGGIGASTHQRNTLAPIGVAQSTEAVKNSPHHHDHHHSSNNVEIKAASGEKVHHHNGTHNGTHHHNCTHNGTHHRNGTRRFATTNGPLPSFAARDGKGNNAQWPLHPIHSGTYNGLATNGPVHHKSHHQNHHTATEDSTLTTSPVPAPAAIVVSDPDHAI